VTSSRLSLCFSHIAIPAIIHPPVRPDFSLVRPEALSKGIPCKNKGNDCLSPNGSEFS
jgi:hypothetical protein